MPKNQQILMTPLFRRLQPAKKFRITIGAIAHLLKIPKRLIVRVECWAYVLFIHRTDKGGQFISYRRLQHWLNAVACQIQQCSNCEQLRSLWLAIEEDYIKHKKQYDDKSQPFLHKIWTKRWHNLIVECVATHSTDSSVLKEQYIA
jgi:hypothetical protein